MPDNRTEENRDFLLRLEDGGREAMLGLSDAEAKRQGVNLLGGGNYGRSYGNLDIGRADPVSGSLTLVDKKNRTDGEDIRLYVDPRGDCVRVHTQMTVDWNDIPVDLTIRADGTMIDNLPKGGRTPPAIRALAGEIHSHVIQSLGLMRGGKGLKLSERIAARGIELKPARADANTFLGRAAVETGVTDRIGPNAAAALVDNMTDMQGGGALTAGKDSFDALMSREIGVAAKEYGGKHAGFKLPNSASLGNRLGIIFGAVVGGHALLNGDPATAAEVVIPGAAAVKAAADGRPAQAVIEGLSEVIGPLAEPVALAVRVMGGDTDSILYDLASEDLKSRRALTERLSPLYKKVIDTQKAMVSEGGVLGNVQPQMTPKERMKWLRGLTDEEICENQEKLEAHGLTQEATAMMEFRELDSARRELGHWLTDPDRQMTLQHEAIRDARQRTILAASAP